MLYKTTQVGGGESKPSQANKQTKKASCGQPCCQKLEHICSTLGSRGVKLHVLLMLILLIFERLLTPDATGKERQQGPLQANKWETFMSNPNTAGFSSKIVAAFLHCIFPERPGFQLRLYNTDLGPYKSSSLYTFCDTQLMTEIRYQVYTGAATFWILRNEAQKIKLNQNNPSYSGA